MLVWKTIPNGSMLSYARAFGNYAGRVWLVTPDLMLVPADRVQPIKQHTFHGVLLGEEVQLPLGWNRTQEPQPLYERRANGTFARLDEDPAKGWVPITGERRGPEDNASRRNRPGVYLRAAVSTVTRLRTKLSSAPSSRAKSRSTPGSPRAR